MSDAELVLGESSLTGPDKTTQYLPTILRLDLANLDALAAAW
jgi:hypothetical protein